MIYHQITMKTFKKQEEKLLAKISLDPHYKGREVALVGSQIHFLSTKNKRAREDLLTRLFKNHPDQTPLIAFVPKDDILVLIF